MKTTKPSLWTRIKLIWAETFNSKKLIDKAYFIWEKELIDKTKEFRKKEEKSKEEAIKLLLKFREGYIIEDEEGNELRKKDMKNLSHKELLELIEMYFEELQKDVGRITEK